MILACTFAPACALAAHAPPLYQLRLPGGRSALVFPDGSAQIFSADRRREAIRRLRGGPRYDRFRNASPYGDRGRVLAQLLQPPPRPFVPNRVLVAFRDGVRVAKDSFTLNVARVRALRAPHARVAPAYTNDARVNGTLAAIGVDRSERLFRRFDRSQLEAPLPQADGGAPIDLANVYRLHVTNASVLRAVALLAKLPSVAYASPDWTVSAMHAVAVPLRPESVTLAQRRQRAIDAAAHLRVFAAAPALPGNYALSASAQSLLDAPGVDLAAAWSEIAARYNQIPGLGEIVTNVSLGDLDDASVIDEPNDPCSSSASTYGPTTIVSSGQRYLDLPSMPLIPTYTADSDGNLDGGGEVCGVDPYLTEIGLDFSVMAPLPDDEQRPGERGSGYTDLLGIAPGASYRLVVPASPAAAISDIDAALLAAANQTPKPNAITASLGFGYDQYGFPSRYLEEDPLTERTIAAIVRQNIVVCVASGDGTRTYTKVAIGPSGGSVPTDLATASAPPTVLTDDDLSTIPSRVRDSGSIDAGGTTLDDIFANPPQYATQPATIAQQAYPETRWTGFTLFSSGFGPRVDVSAPSDNVLSFQHAYRGGADSVDVVLEGGTSASAPETAAAAAVVLQVARLTGHPFASALAVRTFLRRTAVAVPAVPQADTNLAVGPQIDLRAAVEALFEKAGIHPRAGVDGVAVAQRRDYADGDASFVSDTDPSDVDLQGPSNSGANQLAWITIAPNWTFVPKNAAYRLFVKGHPAKPLATTAWARLLPATIFKAAGLPATSTTSRGVSLVYEAREGRTVVARTGVALTFGANSATIAGALAPKVPATVTGAAIPVSYDLTGVAGLNQPKLVVSEPGRFNPATGQLFHAAYSVALAQPHGTIAVPLSKLQGGGVYGVAVELDSVDGVYSDFAMTRVATHAAGTVRPPAPLLSAGGAAPGHNVQIPFGGAFSVHYDVSNVPGATGAIVEISAAGPTAWGIWNPFNNPNGTIVDRNGVDTGSLYAAPAGGAAGTVTLSAANAGLLPALNEVVRVIPMRFGQPIGEASDVSTISMSGVEALDGGSVENGWGINQHGYDGFVTSTQQTADGTLLGSLETFSQTTNAILDVAGSQSNGVYFTNGWGVYANDIGLFGDEDATSGTSTYHLLNTVASGTIGNAWTPPILSSFTINGWLLDASNDETSNEAAFLAYDGSSYSVFTSDLAKNTFSAAYDIMGPLSLFRAPIAFGAAVDSATNTAFVPVYDLDTGSCAPPSIVTANLGTGAVGSIGGVGAGTPNSIAVDSNTGKIAVPTNCDSGLGIYDIASGSAVEVPLPAQPDGVGFGTFTAADSLHGLFLVAQPDAPNVLTDDNSLSRVLVYDEAGRLQETIARFCICQTFTFGIDDQLQLNPSTRTGYMVDATLQQLIPFKY